jgi:hypothetical protein
LFSRERNLAAQALFALVYVETLYHLFADLVVEAKIK